MIDQREAERIMNDALKSEPTSLEKEFLSKLGKTIESKASTGASQCIITIHNSTKVRRHVVRFKLLQLGYDVSHLETNFRKQARQLLIVSWSISKGRFLTHGVSELHEAVGEQTDEPESTTDICEVSDDGRFSAGETRRIEKLTDESSSGDS